MLTRTRFTVVAAAGLAAALLACAGAVAQEAIEPISNLRLSGFGTVGLTHDASGTLGFRRDVSQPATRARTRGDIDSRFGVQANYTVNAQFELVGQIQLKRRVASSPPADSLEWAFASYKPTPDLTIRAGRTSPDIFLLSDYRNVGFAYPWVRPNVEAYGMLPVFSIEGLDITKIWDLGDVRWRGKLFAGQGHTRTPNDRAPDLNVRFGKLFGATLSRESGGLLLRGTFARFNVDIGEQAWKLNLRQALGQIAALPIPQIAAEARQLADGIDPDRTLVTYFALGASYERDDWLLSAEAVRVRSQMAYALSDTGYVSVGRRFGAVTLFGMLGAGRTPRAAPELPQWAATLTPVVGPAAAAAIQDAGNAGAVSAAASRIDQRSLSLGMRWDLHPQLALKLQWDHLMVLRNGSVLWAERDLEPARVNVGSVVLDFVF